MTYWKHVFQFCTHIHVYCHEFEHTCKTLCISNGVYFTDNINSGSSENLLYRVNVSIVFGGLVHYYTTINVEDFRHGSY